MYIYINNLLVLGLTSIWRKKVLKNCPGGPIVKNLPTKAGHTDSIPGPGSFPTLQGHYVGVPRPLKAEGSRACGSATREATTVRSLCAATGE